VAELRDGVEIAEPKASTPARPKRAVETLARVTSAA
jgi:hypothetical protein